MIWNILTLIVIVILAGMTLAVGYWVFLILSLFV